MGEVIMRRRLCCPEPWQLLLAAVTVSAAAGAFAQTLNGPNGKVSFGPRIYDAPRPATDAAKLPGNSWASILALPPIMGGSWSNGLLGLARTSVLTNIDYPPLKPNYLKQSQQRVADILAGKAEFPEGSCRPPGMPRLVYHSMGPVFMEEPGVIAMFGTEVRKITMDGRPHPAELSDPNALVMLSTRGDSIGKWDKGTLVIDTIGVDPNVELFYGVPNGGDMHIVERYWLADPDTLKLEMTIDAPHVLTRPWIYTDSFRRMPDANIIPDDCDPAVVREKLNDKGGAELDLTPPGGYPPGTSNETQ